MMTSGEVEFNSWPTGHRIVGLYRRYSMKAEAADPAFQVSDLEAQHVITNCSISDRDANCFFTNLPTPPDLSLANQQIWYAINQTAGRDLFIAGVLTFLAAIILFIIRDRLPVMSVRLLELSSGFMVS
jgi:hypothetical protein